MKMENRLAPVCPVVNELSIAVGQAPLLGARSGNQKQLPEQLLIFVLRLFQHGDRLFRDDQEVDWRLGADVVESESLKATFLH